MEEEVTGGGGVGEEVTRRDAEGEGVLTRHALPAIYFVEYLHTYIRTIHSYACVADSYSLHIKTADGLSTGTTLVAG